MFTARHLPLMAPWWEPSREARSPPNVGSGRIGSAAWRHGACGDHAGRRFRYITTRVRAAASLFEVRCSGSPVPSLIGPFWSSAFRPIHHCSVDITRGLALLFGIGTIGPSSMGYEDEAGQSFDRTCHRARTVQGTRRTHLIHRPARDIIPPLGGIRMLSYRLGSKIFMPP
jgi:hypothetical protein